MADKETWTMDVHRNSRKRSEKHHTLRRSGTCVPMIVWYKTMFNQTMVQHYYQTLPPGDVSP